MRLHVLLLCLLAALVATGCSKKSSKEFHKLNADQESLVLRDGDDAYVSAEMDAIVAGLNAVPEDALEKPRAMALVQKLGAEKARVEAEKAAAKTPEPTAAAEPPPPSLGEPTTTAEPVAAAPTEVTDAGPPPEVAPTLGMSKADFQKNFSRCFSDGPKMKLSSGSDAAASMVLAASADCQKKFGPTPPGGRTLYLFNDKGLAEKATEVTQEVDAGQLVIPGRQPPTPDPGPPVLTVPGAPAQPPVGADGR